MYASTHYNMYLCMCVYICIQTFVLKPLPCNTLSRNCYPPNDLAL